MRTFAVVVLLTLAAAPRPAQAENPVEPGQERFKLVLGAFLPAFGTEVRVDNPTLGRGTETDLRDDFGVDRNSSGLWAGAEWRFAPRHRVGFVYSSFKLEGSRTATRNIQIGDEVYPAGATVSAQLKINIVPVTYSYSIYKRDDRELALTAGLHWSHVKFSAQGSASAGAFDVSNDTSAKANLPLPLFGVRYEHYFGRDWSVGAQAAYFQLKYEKAPVKADGSLWSARVNAEYRLTRNLGVGVAIEAFSIEAEASQDDWKGGLEYSYWGPQIYLTARF